MECWSERMMLPPRLFGGMPVVYFDAPEAPGWRNAASVVCDDGAVARAAFKELSSGLPPAYAAVAPGLARKWAANRIAAFRGLCRAEGKTCAVFPQCAGESGDGRATRLAAWAAKLPDHVAVFAVNDSTAWEIAAAFRAIGRRFPNDATLVGVDAIDNPKADESAASVSSIRLDFERAGYAAAKLLGGLMASAERKAGCAARTAARRCAPDATFGPLLVEKRQSTRGRRRREPFIIEALEIIRRETAEGLTADALAKRMPVSRKHFERRFREAVGHSILQEIADVRLEMVLDLLSRPSPCIGVIAQLCGFGSESALRTVFHRRFGVSMRRWRESHAT